MPFLTGTEVISLQLVGRDFYERIVPQYLNRQDTLLITHNDKIGSHILVDATTIRSLKKLLGN